MKISGLRGVSGIVETSIEEHSDYVIVADGTHRQESGDLHQRKRPVSTMETVRTSVRCGGVVRLHKPECH